MYQVVPFDQPMFRIAFEGDPRPIADFLAWCHDTHVYDTLRDHPLGPSPIWQQWAARTSLGISGSRVLVESGHAFAAAVSTHPPPWWRPRRSVAAPRRSIPAVHQQLETLHPSVYARTAEAVDHGATISGRLLEIGAGAGVHVAYRQLLDPTLRTDVIDLPEACAITYLVLRHVGVDVRLPHESQPAAVSLRLPHQPLPDDACDGAFSMGCWHELLRATGQRYLDLIRAHLRPGGTVQLVMLAQSKQYPETHAGAYDWTGWTAPTVTRLPWQSAVAGQPVVSLLAQRTSR